MRDRDGNEISSRHPYALMVKESINGFKKLGLGNGGAGPWVNRSDRMKEIRAGSGVMKHCVAAHLNCDFSVQRCEYPEHPGIDHLIIRRHDGEPGHPGWTELQKVKDRLAPNGTERFGIEIFPPRAFTVDNANIYHVWVMPQGWDPGIGIHGDQPGWVKC